MRYLFCVVLMMGLVGLPGCCTALKERANRADQLEKQVVLLKTQLADLDKEKKEEVSDLERAQRELERRLKDQLSQYKAKLEMTEKGLVVTFLAEVFFDSGKNDIKEESKPILGEVAQVLNKDVPSSLVNIEGHTDTDPIKYSGWQSNWELASGRALSVLHYFVDECGLKPERLSATSYGEFKPVADNDTKESKQKNRRVEIIILPGELTKVKGS
ncbi:MAG: OmpA family protein [Candidatus Omnitrophica bacterium]|nr:OmpA family protein [Candidatus Omnitrophota bacterium]